MRRELMTSHLRVLAEETVKDQRLREFYRILRCEAAATFGVISAKFVDAQACSKNASSTGGGKLRA